jgi:hypothetical protein
MHPILAATGLCLLTVVSGHAAAACPAAQATIFACTTTNGKQVQVCDAGRTIGYAFGRPRQTPELSLNVPRARTSTWQWPGFGRTTTYSLSIPNGDTKYTVFSSFDRLAETLQFESGILVAVRGNQVARLLCREQGLIDNLVDVDLPSENAAG